MHCELHEAQTHAADLQVRIYLLGELFPVAATQQAEPDRGSRIGPHHSRVLPRRIVKDLKWLQQSVEGRTRSLRSRGSPKTLLASQVSRKLLAPGQVALRHMHAASGIAHC